MKNRSSKRGCHGNVKLDGPELAKPNCSQINFRKKSTSLVALACLLKKKSYKRFKSVLSVFSPDFLTIYKGHSDLSAG